MKNRPWLLILIGLGAIALAVSILRPVVQGLIAYPQTGFEPDLWFWYELVLRLEAALFLCVGALGILGLKKWGVILFWLSAFVLASHWTRGAFYRETLILLLEHLPLATIPLFYWNRLTWKT
jgi:hypothetical protein